MQLGHALDGQSIDGKSIDKGRPIRLELDLSPSGHVETTGYIAWADALGRAGVRFSDLPEAARQRLNEWLTVNAGAPSYIAPKVAVDRGWGWGAGAKAGSRDREHMAISLEAESDGPEATAGQNGSEGQNDLENGHQNERRHERRHERQNSATVQYEFSSLGTDLTATLRLIGERARALTRGTSAAIALVHKGAVMCRASVGESAPALGTRLDLNSGLSGECFREGKTLRCDDAENDPRVDLENCRRLGVRSILAAPVRYERDTVGLLMVFSPAPFNFDEGDVAVVESLAHTVIRSMRQAEMR